MVFEYFSGSFRPQEPKQLTSFRVSGFKITSWTKVSCETLTLSCNLKGALKSQKLLKATLMWTVISLQWPEAQKEAVLHCRGTGKPSRSGIRSKYK